jgi:thiamine biosynthesis lipoprotein
MSTDGSLTMVTTDPRVADRATEAAIQEVQRVEELMSTFRPESEISRVNRSAGGEPVAVSAPTAEVVRAALRMAETTDGAFDVTYAPLGAAWRKAVQQGREPTEQELEAARALVGTDKVTLTAENRISLAQPGMEVDLGGIAKGYAIDRAARALQEAGVSGGIVDVGHDLRLFGTPEDGGKWRVGVHRPPGVEREFILEVGDCAVTTSGDYARGFHLGNKWYSHIIDPRTGRPATDVTSVTVVGPDATRADALATALSVMGPDEGLALVEGLDEFECLFMTRMQDDTVQFRMSRGFKNLLLEE